MDFSILLTAQDHSGTNKHHRKSLLLCVHDSTRVTTTNFPIQLLTEFTSTRSNCVTDDVMQNGWHQLRVELSGIFFKAGKTGTEN